MKKQIELSCISDGCFSPPAWQRWNGPKWRRIWSSLASSFFQALPGEKYFQLRSWLTFRRVSDRNWPSLGKNWLPRIFGSKSVKSKVAVRENATGTQSTWVLPSYSSWRYTFPLAKLNLLKFKIHICRIYTLNIWIYSAWRGWRGRSLPRGWLRPSHRVPTGLFFIGS